LTRHLFFEAHAKSATMLALTLAASHGPELASGGFFRLRIKIGAKIFVHHHGRGLDKKGKKFTVPA
jgi:hypothetical protein